MSNIRIWQINTKTNRIQATNNRKNSRSNYRRYSRVWLFFLSFNHSHLFDGILSMKNLRNSRCVAAKFGWLIFLLSFVFRICFFLFLSTRTVTNWLIWFLEWSLHATLYFVVSKYRSVVMLALFFHCISCSVVDVMSVVLAIKITSNI